MFCHLCLAERDILLEGRRLSVMESTFYMCHACLQSHLDMLDGNDDTESMIPEVVGDVKMPRAANKISPMLNVGIGCANGRTENGKSCLM